MNRFVRYIQLKFRQWNSDLERIPGLGKYVSKSKKMSLPGLQKVPLYDVMRFFAQSMSKGVVFQRAAAITYRVFVAVVPMIIALFSAIAFLGEDFRNTLISMLQSLVPPYAWPAVEGVITDVVMRQNGTLSSAMLVVGIYFTIICIMGIVAAMTTSYFNEGKRNFLQQIKLSAKRGNYRFFSAGSSICTVLLVILLGFMNLYFSNFTNYNLIYGSLGALFAILLWINWSATVFLMCYDLNVSIAKAKSENIQLSDHLEKEETDNQQDNTPQK